MTVFPRILSAGFGIISTIVVFGFSGASPVQAQSCYDLWYERNQIYAAAGYCFKTRRARSVFGRGCFPPYGDLSRSEQRRVDDIKAQERAYGCRNGRGGGAGPVGPPPGGGGSRYAGMSCGELWYARNEIYARNGHCFNTARGRAAFGRGCFPPYGELGSRDRRRVNRIIRQERRRGCR